MSYKWTEKELDTVLNNGFSHSAKFANWFLSKSRFSNLEASYYWSRADHPWGRFTFELENPYSGEIEAITRDSETDILVVYETPQGNRIAFHIENKLANGKYTLYQPEFYSLRGAAWVDNEKYGKYSDYETVLVAPIEFYANNFGDSQKFDKFISYEEIGLLLPEFAEYLNSGTEKKS